jgi:tRNA pseudouridine38-40 synthase
MKLTRIALLVEYVGKKFHGSQYQLGLRTVQADLESALSIFLKSQIRVIFSGRTDAGVHAYGQVAHADIPAENSANLDLWRLTWAMNGILKNDVAVRAIQIVPDQFHSRFHATSREYVYRVLNRPQRSAIMEDNHYFIPRHLDLPAMQQAAEALVGVHDFIAFRSQTTDKSSTFCYVSRAEILNKGEGQLEFWIAADHFVYNMVRIIAGTLVEIGLSKKAPESLSIALIGKDRNLAGITAPSRGLTLQSVSYPDKYNLFQAQ